MIWSVLEGITLGFAFGIVMALTMIWAMKRDIDKFLEDKATKQDIDKLIEELRRLP